MGETKKSINILERHAGILFPLEGVWQTSFVKHFPEKITLNQIHISKDTKKNKLKKKKKSSFS